MSEVSIKLRSLYFLIILVPAYLLFSFFFPDIINIVSFSSSIQRLFDIAICVTAFSVIFALHYVGFEWLSAPNILLVYIWLFHFGSSFFTSIDPGFWKTFPWGEQWTLVRSWQEALLYSTLCCIAFTIGCLYSTIHFKRKNIVEPEAENENLNLFYAGIICFGIGVILTIKTFFSCGGFALFSMDYVSVLTDFGNNTSACVAFSSIGMLMAASAAPKRMLKYLLLSQAPLTLFYLVLGMRTMALPVPLVLLVVLAKRGIKMPLWKLAAIFMAFLFLIVLAKNVRDTGSGISGAANISASSLVPVDAVIEMGTTLQVVSLVFQWTDGGANYRYGGGYWAGVERMRRMFGIRNPEDDSAEGDPRTLAYMVSVYRTGFGGTNIGESYLNFGMFGSLLFFLPLGYILGSLDIKAKSCNLTGICCVTLWMFVWHARNYFTQVPPFILFTCFCWGVQLLWVKKIRIPQYLIIRSPVQQ